MDDIASAPITPEDLEWARARLDAQAVAAIEAAERQRCVENVCSFCAGAIAGYTPAVNPEGKEGMWIHFYQGAGRPRRGQLCGARNIHERAAREVEG